MLHNASPAAVFDRLLAGGSGRRPEGNWFDVVAPAEHQQLYQLVRRTYGEELDLPGGARLPEQVQQLSGAPRDALRRAIPRDWGADCAAAYRSLVDATAERSAQRWTEGLTGSAGQDRSLLWRILRLASAPYFVLGTGPSSSLRLRVATPWDWNQGYELRRLDVAAEPGGQARVGWRAQVRDRATGAEQEVAGHVEVRWSHGRFGGHPEAKVYLDTPHAQVPGYFPLV